MERETREEKIREGEGVISDKLLRYYKRLENQMLELGKKLIDPPRSDFELFYLLLSVFYFLLVFFFGLVQCSLYLFFSYCCTFI
ncbi:hypothetical protein EUTSA_v10021858mg [Eutrema salsugineum]|uniref:Uncharacterized protein n=1 Tax=Eutrema salsugineum TaxID=72664 RepID=V4M9E5_EUTSA|nr:hypothetical protein EUTSA_v10021858mg [Eutrema salsugineum]